MSIGFCDHNSLWTGIEVGYYSESKMLDKDKNRRKKNELLLGARVKMQWLKFLLGCISCIM